FCFLFFFFLFFSIIFLLTRICLTNTLHRVFVAVRARLQSPIVRAAGTVPALRADKRDPEERRPAS
ncbi:hypothetical protein ABZ780_30345, partial [Micromonospora sp. NPDC047467]|uniref:hypothetical protein n=1 Tax=Micromonospora sp. NPDC047467 TaxID=3154814 RepID=UPI0033F197F1